MRQFTTAVIDRRYSTNQNLALWWIALWAMRYHGQRFQPSQRRSSTFTSVRRDKSTSAAGQLAKRQIGFDAADIGLIDQNCFAQLAFTFCVFGGQQVAAR